MRYSSRASSAGERLYATSHESEDDEGSRVDPLRGGAAARSWNEPANVSVRVAPGARHPSVGRGPADGKSATGWLAPDRPRRVVALGAGRIPAESPRARLRRWAEHRHRLPLRGRQSGAPAG